MFIFSDILSIFWLISQRYESPQLYSTRTCSYIVFNPFFQISLTILISLQMRKIMDSPTNLHEHIDRPTRQQQFFDRLNILLDV